MTKQEKIIKAIESDKNLMKRINKSGLTSVDDFINNAKRYIKASNDNRLFSLINTVSSSGMSRTMKFIEFNKYVYNFYTLFDLMGHQKVSNSDYFRISGCGMDMVFATHYNIMHELCSLGFITKAKCKILAQRTPSLIS